MDKIYSIGIIPISPGNSSSSLLRLSWNAKGQQGVWQYGDRALSLAFEWEEILFNNTIPEGETRSGKRKAATRIDCSEWVAAFGDWPLENLHTSSGKNLIWEDDERKTLYCSGFRFDEISGEWSCTWEKREMMCIYSSDKEHNLTVKLCLNLQGLTGCYSEQHYADVRG